MSVAEMVPFDPMGQFSGVAGDVRDPYPEFWNKRRDQPVALMEDGSYEIFPYDLVSAAMRDSETLPSGSIREFMSVVMGPYPLVGMDEPEHRRLRNLVAQAFRQRTLEHWDQDVVIPVVDEMIDKFASRGSADLVSEFTYHYPAMVIAEILGLPRADNEFFQPRALAVINVAVRPEEGIVASEELRDYFEGFMDERRKRPGTDIISELVQAELDGEVLGDEEIFSFLRLLLPAGAETTFAAMGSCLFALLSDPGALDRVRADYGLLDAVIDETLRWETSVTMVNRETTCPVEIDGVEVPAGVSLVCATGSANRDEARYSDPTRWDLERNEGPHIAFGTGRHQCLGMHLARMELRIGLEAVLTRLEGLRFDAEAGPVRIAGLAFRSPPSLPVRYDAVAPARPG